MKVVHIAPTYFDELSVIGGGERYPSELSAHMAKLVETTLVSFSSARRSYRQDELKVELYPVRRFIHENRVNPLSFRYLTAIRKADVIHVHHVHTLVSDLACLAASVFRKPSFVTDYGGGGSLVLNRRLAVLERYRAAIAYSQYGADFLPPELKSKTVLIKGGIDTTRFSPDPSRPREKRILFVGRILPHKGINYLVDAFRLLNRDDFNLRIVGRVCNEEFYSQLKLQANGLPVTFIHDADDRRLLDEYRAATVTVLPSVHRSINGQYTQVPELMGFSLLESQACGTPVVCTDAGAMHEFVDHGRTGFVVEQNSGEGIANAVHKIIDATPDELSAYQKRCREWTIQIDWSTVVKACLKAYSDGAEAKTISRSA